MSANARKEGTWPERRLGSARWNGPGDSTRTQRSAPSVRLRRHASCLGFALLALGLAGLACAQDAARPETKLRQPRDVRSFWPLMHEPLAWTTGIPMHLRYEEMDARQQALVKSQYDKLGPDDEPPFPAEGLAPLIQALHQAQSHLLVTGDLYLVADVDAKGLPSTVSAFSSPSPKMTRIAAEILMLTRFKPGRCAGEPCPQQFPLRLQFRLN